MDPQLSDKAKGKRRAFDHEEDDIESTGSFSSNTAPSKNAPNISRSFTVRFSEGVSDLTMTVGPQDTVREVQRRVG